MVDQSIILDDHL